MSGSTTDELITRLRALTTDLAHGFESIVDAVDESNLDEPVLPEALRELDCAMRNLMGVVTLLRRIVGTEACDMTRKELSLEAPDVARRYWQSVVIYLEKGYGLSAQDLINVGCALRELLEGSSPLDALCIDSRGGRPSLHKRDFRITRKYLALRESGTRGAAKILAKEWGLSVVAIQGIVKKNRKDVAEDIREFDELGIRFAEQGENDQRF